MADPVQFTSAWIDGRLAVSLDGEILFVATWVDGRWIIEGDMDQLTAIFGGGGEGGGGTGDVVGPAASVDGELAVFDGTTGKVLDRSTGTGIIHLIDGVMSFAVEGEDYAPATETTGILKGDGFGGFEDATADVDFAGPDHTHVPSEVGLGNVTNDAQLKATDLDTGSLLGGVSSSDTKIPSQLAVKTYVDTMFPDDDGFVDAFLQTDGFGLRSWGYPEGTGDVSGPAVSVAGELAVYSGTSGKIITRASITGLLKAVSGVLAEAVESEDYAPATPGSSILMGDGFGGFDEAVVGIDYAPPTVGSEILMGDGAGGFSDAVAGTHYAAALHTHPASSIASGVIDRARLADGTPSANTYPDGTGNWTTPTSVFPVSQETVVLEPATEALDFNNAFALGNTTPGLVEISPVFGTSAGEFAEGDHLHDDRYFTESEITTLLAAKVSDTGDSITGAYTITNTTTDAALKVDQNADASASTSVGGAILLENTGNLGAGFIIYSNAGASATGRLMNIRADNAAFPQAALHIDYDGTANALEVVNNSTDASSQAFNVVSHNPNDSSFTVTGEETGKGTAKIVHIGQADGSDSSSSAISVDLQTEGTAAQGIYVDATSGTIGDLLKLRNSSVDKFVVDSEGNLETVGLILGRDITADGAIIDGLGTASTMDGPSGDIVGTTDVQELTNKTLTDAIISGGSISDIAEEDVILVSGGGATYSFESSTPPPFHVTYILPSFGGTLLEEGDLVPYSQNQNVGWTNPPGPTPINATDVTALASGQSAARYIGQVPFDCTEVVIRCYVATQLASTTWSEMAIATAANATSSSLTLVGSAISLNATFNSTGLKTVNIPAVIPAGSHIYVLFGSQASTPFQLRACPADYLSTGITRLEALRPSTMPSPSGWSTSTAITGMAWFMFRYI